MVTSPSRLILKNEKGFREIAQLMSEPIWIADKDGNVVWYNKTYGKVMGVDKSVIRPEDWRDLPLKGDFGDLREKFEKASKNKTSWKVVFGISSAEGKTKWYIARADPILDEKGELRKWIGFNTEITKQKRIEHELRLSQERYEMASLASESVIWDWNLETNQVQWNQAMERRLKHQLPHLVTDIQWWDEHIHPMDQKRVVEGIQTCIEEKQSSWHDEYRFLKGDGDYAVIKDKGFIVFSDKGKPTRMIGAMSDVTWERKAMERLREAKKSADLANSAKSAFLANVSHEVRTPLSTILGYVELLKSEELDEGSMKEFIDVIERNGHQVLRILDDVLDLAKVESGALEIQEVAFYVEELVRDMKLVMGAKAQQKDLQFSIKVDSEMPKKLLSDPVRIKQVMINMLSNALKFTETGKVELSLSYQQPCLNITVADTGAGISQHLQETIFKPFNQGDPSIQRKYGGSGLGLALARRLCEAMGGKFELVESKVGQGSVFRARFEVRVDNGDKKPKPETNKKREHPLKGNRILVVDDSSEIRLLVQRLLGNAGARVDAASSGKKAVVLASECHYDLILLDIQMPRMDGYETLKEIRKTGCQAPVVALTAHAMKEDREKAMQAGFSSFVTKPMKTDKIIRLVQTLN